MTTMNKLEWVNCPSCGAKIPLKPHPEKPGRLLATCDCISRGNASRGVLETDEPAKTTKKEKEEVKDG